MSISTNKYISNFANNKNVRGFVSKLCTPAALLPVVMLEATVIGGRTYQAQKRGGDIESKERFTEEIIASAVWLWGVKFFNKSLDFLINKVGKIKEKTGLKDFNFDTGRDDVRAPFEHATKGLDSKTKKFIAALKFSKIAASTALAVGTIGFVLPKINQRITKHRLEKRNQQKEQQIQPIKISSRQKRAMGINEFLVTSRGSVGDPSNILSPNFSRRKNNGTTFSNGTFFELAAHGMENNSIVQLLTQDAGLCTGRGINARNKYERHEILFRDIVSAFFYVASTPLIYKGLCKLDSFSGKNTELSPNRAGELHDDMMKLFGNEQSMSKADFSRKIFGTQQVSDKIFNKAHGLLNKEIVTVDSMHKFIDENISDSKFAETLKAKAVNLSELQPSRNSKKILTKSQLTNLFYDGLLNDPKVINPLINKATAEKAMNPFKFVSQKAVDKKRQTIIDYAQSIVTQADKRKQSVISKDLLKEMKTRNLITKFGYWGAGMAVSAFFLSTAIPKIQYLITQKTTGQDKFPGVQTYK